jgi:hypothetical protein
MKSAQAVEAAGKVEGFDPFANPSPSRQKARRR